MECAQKNNEAIARAGTRLIDAPESGGEERAPPIDGSGRGGVRDEEAAAVVLRSARSIGAMRPLLLASAKAQEDDSITPTSSRFKRESIRLINPRDKVLHSDASAKRSVTARGRHRLQPKRTIGLLYCRKEIGMR
uniref:Uncharacterized protein n=1 Tax=Odontella aurita TaxID=265563 RepID=A0A7S4ICM1_9STRA|mmetsp:Transcript_2299/g.6064  ORF Transcript_2299/g.6064 Transcript_2299/m.6064 type:complete len:135 (+) Transcript_2299:598-1002(+)